MYNLEKIWPEWKAVRVIGEGSSGKVYEIVRNKMGIEEHSALKVISVPHSQSETNVLLSEGMDEKSTADYYQSIVNAFVQEISLMSKLKGHPNIVTYEDYQVVKHDNDIGWDILIRMELLTPFSEITRTNGFDVANTVDFALQICEALSVCHKNSILHRDIKYDNIFVSKMGTYKLGDFGVARKLEKTSGNFSLKGTYTYMAPEIYKGQAYGVASDIYSFGIVLYRLLNKNREAFVPLPPQPIKLSDKENALIKRMGGENLPAPVDADSELSRIVLKACAFYTSDRYKSIDELKDDLYNYKTNKSNLKEDVIVSDSDDDKTVSVFSAYDEAKVVYMSDDDKTSAVFTTAPIGSIAAESNVPDNVVLSETDLKQEAHIDVAFEKTDDEEKTVAVFGYTPNDNLSNDAIENFDKEKNGGAKSSKKKAFVIVSIIVAIMMIVLTIGIVVSLDNAKEESSSREKNNDAAQKQEKETADSETTVYNDNDDQYTQGSTYDDMYETKKWNYEEGKNYFSDYSASLSNDSLQKAIDSFEIADDYADADYYLNIAQICNSSDEKAVVSGLKPYAIDNYVQDILESNKYIQRFLEDSRWISDDYQYFLSVKKDSFSTDYNLPSYGYEEPDKNDEIYYYYLDNACYTACFKESDPIEFWSISILDEDSISVYCYETSSSINLKRYPF